MKHEWKLHFAYNKLSLLKVFHVYDNSPGVSTFWNGSNMFQVAISPWAWIHKLAIMEYTWI